MTERNRMITGRACCVNTLFQKLDTLLGDRPTAGSKRVPSKNEDKRINRLSLARLLTSRKVGFCSDGSDARHVVGEAGATSSLPTPKTRDPLHLTPNHLELKPTRDHAPTIRPIFPRSATTTPAKRARTGASDCSTPRPLVLFFSYGHFR